ncbi:MAG: transposase [Patescibacteria group bacterium]
MAERKINFSLDEYYHIYNRGTDKREIFLDDLDKERFLKLLFVSNGDKSFVFRDFPIGLPYVKFDRGEPRTAIGAYCLMPNHFHLLVRETSENGITKFISKVLTSYSMYFNKKYNRSGRLFEGTFKAKHIDNDRYLKYLFAYIHLNPVKLIDKNWKENVIADKKAAKNYLKNYKYSSYMDYQNKQRTEKIILNKKVFPDYFSTKTDFSDFINDWLSLKADTP